MSAKKRPVRAVLVVEPGYVWCDKLGKIHDDTLDPYQMGGDNRCNHEDHYPVYVRRRGEEAAR